MGLIYNQVYCFEIRNKVHGSLLMKCIQKSNTMWTHCYAQSYKPAETLMPRAGRKKSQGVKLTDPYNISYKSLFTKEKNYIHNSGTSGQYGNTWSSHTTDAAASCAEP